MDEPERHIRFCSQVLNFPPPLGIVEDRLGGVAAQEIGQMLGAEALAAIEGGGTVLHLDVMDGHFVPNITIGPPVVESLRKITKMKLDVHLMIADPDLYAPAFIQAGADHVIVHQ